jgi:hypothetical protein
MAEIPLDHFFNVVCREIADEHDLLRNAIIHYVTASSQLPRLRRAAQAWQPRTPIHHKYKRLMLAKDLQPLTRDQLTPEVVALMKTLQDWLRTNWYQKGEIMFNKQLAARDPTHATWGNAATKEPTHG